MIHYRKATLEDLERIWDYNIAQDPDEPRNQHWKESYIHRNVSNRASTYVILSDEEPVGEVTLDYFAEAHGNPANRPMLADGRTTAYVTALRIRKTFEGQGLVSELMHCMEADARKKGFSQLTIGVEAAQTRTLAIYLRWGYDRFVMGEMEDGELVLFYAKAL